MPSETTTCKTCGDAIFWARTKNNKRIPLDAEPVDNGNLRLLDGIAIVLSPIEQACVRGPRYVSHFATCRDATKHRRRA